ncbi:MAG: chorismate synthase [Treponemataceae bacterium]
MSFGNSFGNIFRITSFGESRGDALGVVIEGCPAGLELSEDDFRIALTERKAKYFFETPRAEKDEPKIISGLFKNRTLGTPITIIVENENKSEKNYETLKDIFRPGHADANWEAKFGFRDFRGGGRSSGRETLARVLAGTVAKKILIKKNITVRAFPKEVAGLACKADGSFTDDILEKLHEVQSSGNSCGGIVACEVTGVPQGLGEPVFAKLDAELAKAILSIGAIKGIEFGAGFAFAEMDGSTSNDIEKNYNGGILGGISSSEKIYFNACVKPVPSISLEQVALNKSGKKVSIKVNGQHDTCLVRRICPVVESMTAITIVDFILLAKTNRIECL